MASPLRMRRASLLEVAFLWIIKSTNSWKIISKSDTGNLTGNHPQPATAKEAHKGVRGEIFTVARPTNAMSSKLVPNFQPSPNS